jgi:hypothetical protein
MVAFQFVSPYARGAAESVAIAPMGKPFTRNSMRVMPPPAA